MDNTLGNFLIDTAMATPLLAAITPSIAFAAVNTTFFTRRQIRNTVAFMGCLGILLCAMLLAAAWLGFSATAINSVSGLLTAALLLGMNDTLFRELLPRRRARLLTQCGIAAVVIALCVFQPIVATLLCLVYFALSCHDLRRNIGKGGGTSIYTDEPLHTESVPTCDKAEIPFSEHPNIYCFYLESVHSEKAIQELYHSDVGQDVRLFLEKYGYRVYPEANATMDWTIVSRTTLIEHRIPWDYNDRGSIRNPWVLRILRENGYRIKLFDVDNTAYVLGEYADAADFCSFELPRFVLRCFRLMAPLFAQSRAFRWLVGGRDPGATEPMGEAAYFTLLRQNIRDAKADAPEFSLIRFGAPHAAYYDATWKPSNWPVTYLQGYDQAMRHLKALVEDIHTYDPEACVVIVGDHGAHSLDNTWMHQDTPMDGIAAHAVSLEMLYLDLFSVLCAVKWPSRGEPEGFSPAHINLFVWIFLSLSGREELRQSLVPNICLLSHRWRDFYLLARDRKPLPVLQRFTGTDEMLAWQQQNDAAYEKDWRFHYVALKKLLSLAPTPHVLDRLRQESEKLLPLLPNTNEGLHIRAEVRLRVQRDPRLAIPSYEMLLSKGTATEKDWTRLLFCYQLLGNTAAALNVLEKGAGRFYAAEQLPSRTAHLYYTMGNLDAAYERCLLLTKNHPDSYDYTKLLYRIVYARGDLQHAYAILEKYGSLCAERGQHLAKPQDFYKNSGLSALLLSRWDDAARAFEKQRASGGEGVWLTALEAFALEQTGAIAQALELWQQQQYISPAWSELRALFAVRNHIGPDTWREEGEKLLLRQETTLAEAGLCLMPSEKLRHWLCTGVFLGEKPNELFDPFFYLSYNSEAFLNGSNPLINYIKNPLCWTSPAFFAYRYYVQHPKWQQYGGTPLAAALNRQPSKGAADI